ncbi:MAG: MFS transporter [bacterium]
MKSLVNKYYLFQFLTSFTFFSAVLVPFFTEWGHITLAQTQMIQSWFMFWVFVLEVPTGAVADYFGRKVSIILGAIIFALGTIVYASSPVFYNFLLGELILATGVALLSGAGEALLYDNLKLLGKETESKKIFGKAHAVRMMSMLIAAPLGSFIASKWGLNYPMLLTSIPTFLAVIVAFTIPEVRVTLTNESERYLIIAKKGVTYFIHHKILRELAINSILVASASYFIIWFYQPILIAQGYAVSTFGWFHVFLLLSELLVSSQFARLEKLFGSEKRYLQVSALFVGLAILAAAIWPNTVTVIILLAIGGGFGLTRIEYVGAIMNRHVESKERATTLSAVSMFRRLALVPLNPIIGLLADRSLSFALFIVSLLPLGVLIWPMMRRLYSGLRRGANTKEQT